MAGSRSSSRDRRVSAPTTGGHRHPSLSSYGDAHDDVDDHNGSRTTTYSMPPSSSSHAPPSSPPAWERLYEDGLFQAARLQVLAEDRRRTDRAVGREQDDYHCRFQPRINLTSASLCDGHPADPLEHAAQLYRHASVIHEKLETKRKARADAEVKDIPPPLQRTRGEIDDLFLRLGRQKKKDLTAAREAQLKQHPFHPVLCPGTESRTVRSGDGEGDGESLVPRCAQLTTASFRQWVKKDDNASRPATATMSPRATSNANAQRRAQPLPQQQQQPTTTTPGTSLTQRQEQRHPTHHKITAPAGPPRCASSSKSRLTTPLRHTAAASRKDPFASLMLSEVQQSAGSKSTTHGTRHCGAVPHGSSGGRGNRSSWTPDGIEVEKEEDRDASTRRRGWWSNGGADGGDEDEGGTLSLEDIRRHQRIIQNAKLTDY